MTEDGNLELAAQLAQELAGARAAELAVGRVRGRIVEFDTQIARAEQGVDLGWRFWIRQHLDHRRRRRRSRASGPLVSVVTPVYDTEPEHLEACLQSVADQTYRDWEHILVDDGSTDPRVGELLARASARDRRV